MMYSSKIEQKNTKTERITENVNILSKPIFNNIKRSKLFLKYENYQKNQNKTYNKKQKKTKKVLKTLSKHYKKKIINMTNTNMIGFNKSINKNNINTLAKYLKILNTIYNRCENKNIYDYLITEISKIVKNSDEIIKLFINNIRYNFKNQDFENISDKYPEIQIAFTTVIENLPNCKVN